MSSFLPFPAGDSPEPADRPPRLLWRVLGVVSGLVLVALFLGCMSMNAESVQPSERGVLTQTGPLTFSGRGPQTVYYPIPYLSPPNLTFDSLWRKEGWEVVEQQWDHFTVRPTGFPGPPSDLKWTAKGLRGPPPPAPVVVVPAKEKQPPPDPDPPNASGLPARPVPVDSADK